MPRFIPVKFLEDSSNGYIDLSRIEAFYKDNTKGFEHTVIETEASTYGVTAPTFDELVACFEDGEEIFPNAFDKDVKVAK